MNHEKFAFSKQVLTWNFGQPWIEEKCIMGIDEAGRGPVLGPMVYAAVFAPQADDLTSSEYADSKALTPEKRGSLFERISGTQRLGAIAEVLPSALISAQMLARDKVSLNAIAADSTISIINAVLQAGVKIEKVFIDTVGDADRYAARLSAIFPGLAFTVCPKADALFPVVSAASIVAKVTRDRIVEEAEKALGDCKLGSGYPSDPDTQHWLRANLDPVFGWGQLVRFSWETANRILSEDGVLPVSWEADEGEPADSTGPRQQRLSFGAGSAAAVETSGVGRCQFFRMRRLACTAECF